MAAGVTDRLWDIEDIVRLVDEAVPKPGLARAAPTKNAIQTHPLPASAADRQARAGRQAPFPTAVQLFRTGVPLRGVTDWSAVAIAGCPISGKALQIGERFRIEAPAPAPVLDFARSKPWRRAENSATVGN